jgi:hypothetical protein
MKTEVDVRVEISFSLCIEHKQELTEELIEEFLDNFNVPDYFDVFGAGAPDVEFDFDEIPDDYGMEPEWKLVKTKNGRLDIVGID